MNKSTIGRLAGPSLIAGALAFGLFWGNSVADLGIPEMVRLALHGSSILLISFGLIGIHLVAPTRTSDRTLARLAVGFAVAGLLTLFPLIGIGFALVGAILMRSGAFVEGAALTLGSLTLVAAYLFGTRIGQEGASDPTTALAIVFGFGIVLILGGLLASGIRYRPPALSS